MRNNSNHTLRILDYLQKRGPKAVGDEGQETLVDEEDEDEDEEEKASFAARLKGL